MAAAPPAATTTAARFDVSMTAGVSVASSWNTTKQRSTTAMQSLAIATVESDAQTDVSALHVSQQLEKCEGIDRMASVPAAKNAGSGWLYPGPHFDTAAVTAFCNEVYDELREELTTNSKSTAFDNYEPNWKPRRQDVSLVGTLPLPTQVNDEAATTTGSSAPPNRSPTTTTGGLLGAAGASRERHVTCLAFNCNGTMLAATFGRTDVAAWCLSKGYVAVWSVAAIFESRANSAATPAPVAVFEADAFVTSIAFHAANPVLLAGGTYNGEILMWTIGGDERTKPMSSTGAPQSPREPVLQLTWLANPRETREQHKYVLCSASGDGKILFWTPSNKLAEPISGYEVQNRKRAVLGVQSLSFVSSGAAGGAGGSKGVAAVPAVQNVMLLGLESGDVFRTKPGNTIGTNAGGQQSAAATTPSGLGILEVDHFDAHRGPVQAVDCSPFFRNLFLTASSDGSIRLFSTLERSPLLTLEPSADSRSYIYGAQFSPLRPSVFAAITRSSQLLVYDLAESKAKPAMTTDAGVDGAPVFSVCWNRATGDVLATGDGRGNVRLWQLSSQLCEPTELERSATVSGAATPAATAAMKQLLGFAC